MIDSLSEEQIRFQSNYQIRNNVLLKIKFKHENHINSISIWYLPKSVPNYYCLSMDVFCSV